MPPVNMAIYTCLSNSGIPQPCSFFHFKVIQRMPQIKRHSHSLDMCQHIPRMHMKALRVIWPKPVEDKEFQPAWPGCARLGLTSSVPALSVSHPHCPVVPACIPENTSWIAKCQKSQEYMDGIGGTSAKTRGFCQSSCKVCHFREVARFLSQKKNIPWFMPNHWL